MVVFTHVSKTEDLGINELQTKRDFDNVGEPSLESAEETTDSSNNTRDSGESYYEQNCKFIVANSPDFRNKNGDTMSFSNDSITENSFFSDESPRSFIKIPRSLFNDPRWKGMREKYKKVFFTLLFHASFTKKTYAIGPNLITINPGQFCTSIRNLMELCNDEVKYQEDKVDKNIVERSVSLFTKFGLVRHEVIHGKSVITITQRELYDHFQNQCDTASETKVRLNRDTNEEYKNVKKEDNVYVLETNDTNDKTNLSKKDASETLHSIDGAVAPDSSLSNLNPENQKRFQILWEYIIKYSMNYGNTHNKKPGIKKKDLEDWINKYDPREILECLKLTLKASPSQTWPGYVNKLLRDKISKRESDAEHGRKVVEQIINKNKMSHIEMMKDYFKDSISDEQTYYYLPQQTIEAVLRRSFERAKEAEREARIRFQEDERYG